MPSKITEKPVEPVEKEGEAIVNDRGNIHKRRKGG